MLIGAGGGRSRSGGSLIDRMFSAAPLSASADRGRSVSVNPSALPRTMSDYSNRENGKKGSQEQQERERGSAVRGGTEGASVDDVSGGKKDDSNVLRDSVMSFQNTIKAKIHRNKLWLALRDDDLEGVISCLEVDLLQSISIYLYLYRYIYVYIICTFV